MNEEIETASPLGRWEELFREQSEIFRTAVTRAAALENEVAELRRENTVWKNAHKTAEDAHDATKKLLSRMERTVDAIKENNPLVICLIDGDGTIFSQELWASGRAGGRQAALLLHKGLTGHIESSDEMVSAHCQVWLSIFCNKKGLMDTLVNNGICSAEEFEDFYHGFNQSSPLFSIVDVGHGKEAADAKIKEHLRIFTRFPQTYKVFLGGSHDNGYSTIINQLSNEGYLDKLVLLKGYKMLAQELKTFNLAECEIQGLFMTTKLAGAGHLRNRSMSPTKQPHNETSTSKAKVFPDGRARLAISQHHSTSLNLMTEHTTGLKVYNASIPLKNYKPSPCMWYYLSTCKNGSQCRYAHDYQPTPQLLEKLKITAKSTPCRSVAKNQNCKQGSTCYLGHICPRGPACHFLKAKKCKFTGKNSHNPQGGTAAANLYFGAMRIVDEAQYSSDAYASSSGSPSNSDMQELEPEDY